MENKMETLVVVPPDSGACKDKSLPSNDSGAIVVSPSSCSTSSPLSSDSKMEETMSTTSSISATSEFQYISPSLLNGAITTTTTKPRKMKMSTSTMSVSTGVSSSASLSTSGSVSDLVAETVEELQMQVRLLLTQNQRLRKERNAALEELDELDGMRRKVQELTFKNDKLKQKQKQQEQLLRQQDNGLQNHEKTHQKEQQRREGRRPSLEVTLPWGANSAEKSLPSDANHSNAGAAATLQSLQTAVGMLHSASAEEKIRKDQENRSLQSQVAFYSLELANIKEEREEWNIERERLLRQLVEAEEQAAAALSMNTTHDEEEEDDDVWVLDRQNGERDAYADAAKKESIVILSNNLTERAYTSTMEHLKKSLEQLEEENQNLIQVKLEHQNIISAMEEELDLRETKIEMLQSLVVQTVDENEKNKTALVKSTEAKQTHNRKWKVGLIGAHLFQFQQNMAFAAAAPAMKATKDAAAAAAAEASSGKKIGKEDDVDLLSAPPSPSSLLRGQSASSTSSTSSPRPSFPPTKSNLFARRFFSSSRKQAITEKKVEDGDATVQTEVETRVPPSSAASLLLSSSSFPVDSTSQVVFEEQEDKNHPTTTVPSTA